MGVTGTVPGSRSLLEAYENREAGEKISVYDVVYLDGKLIKKADASDRNKMPAAAMAGESARQGELIDAWYRGIVTNSTWNFTSGARLFLMSGGVIGHNAPEVSGNVVQSLGRALTKTTIHFNPEVNTMIVGH